MRLFCARAAGVAGTSSGQASGASVAWDRERRRDLRVSRRVRCLSGRMSSVSTSVSSSKHPNTPMSDNLPKMRIHFVENTYLMQNIVIRCVFYP